MADVENISVPGQSGKKYTFGIYNFPGEWNEVAGIYILATSTTKTDGGKIYTPIYIGETDDLKVRFSNHHKQACFDREHPGYLLWHGEGSQITRRAIEQDLIAKFTPVCND